jgi:hypothetical protein
MELALTGVAGFFSEAGPVTDIPVPTYLLSWAIAGENANIVRRAAIVFMAIAPKTSPGANGTSDEETPGVNSATANSH